MAFKKVMISSVMISSALFAEADPIEIEDRIFKKIPVSALRSLPHFGVLKINQNGFLYVDVDDNYIHQLIRFIEDEGFEKPPYFGAPDLVGAHITVGLVENPDHVECGRVVSFRPIRCARVTPSSESEIKEAYVIDVEAPDLSEIQKLYGLSNQKIPFHITVGVKKKTPFSGELGTV
jgi:hypothetical protein